MVPNMSLILWLVKSLVNNSIFVGSSLNSKKSWGEYICLYKALPSQRMLSIWSLVHLVVCLSFEYAIAATLLGTHCLPNDWSENWSVWSWWNVPATITVKGSASVYGIRPGFCSIPMIISRMHINWTAPICL